MTDSRPLRTPSSLRKAGRALWRSIASQLNDDGLLPDARERELLEQACHEADILDAITTALDGEPMTVRGAQGQMVAHPLIGEARRSRTTIAALLGKLELSDPTTTSGTGSGSRTTPWQARSAAMTRHIGGR